MKEARLMRQLSHPNIVRFYGIAAEEEPLMIVMEFVKGGSLDAYLIKKNEDVSIEEREIMCTDAASGLAYLHSWNRLISQAEYAYPCSVINGRSQIFLLVNMVVSHMKRLQLAYGGSSQSYGSFEGSFGGGTHDCFAW